MSKKQKTLFESWNQSSSKVIHAIPKKNDTNNLPSTSAYNSPSHNAFQPNTFSRTEPQSVGDEFDYEAGKTWIYPTNYPVRDYQFSIVQEALFKNTLVILPTGLGKTFIAAVVMYNIYRWYPKGKVVFMAPTRPLVAQQIDACYKVTGISPVDTTQMTGTNMPDERKRMWAKKRVFFLTPQVLANDLVRNICSAASIKCIVVDEAHKALGNHAYCQVIRELQAHTNHFRVLALTATPGSDTQAVKTVYTNLLISHVEMRTEDSADVKEYTHIRDIEKIVVPLGDRLSSIKSRFLDVINIYLKRLTQRRVMTSKNPSSLSKYQILRLREEFSQHPPDRISKSDYGLAMADFSLCISLYHAYELLLLHGARPFHNFLSAILNGDKSIPHARAELLRNFDFEELMKEVQVNYVTESIQNGPNINMGANGTRVLPGHPKLEKLLEIVLRHFRTMSSDSVTSTRVMIFSQYRDSVDEIVEMLNHHQPMIKVMSFIGQSSKSATSVGYSQKHQLKVIQDFRLGGYNTLVSTCVGEEGLDIGEVDLIVCYDCPKSPIRLVQRMGRTGRLRKGRIVILVAEGKEEQMYNSCESKKKAVHRAISKGSAFTHLNHSSPSLIPPGVKPICVKTVVKVEALTPFLKMKGKAQESAFLNEREMLEFNRSFKVPRSTRPLLQQSDFVSLKSHGQLQNGQDNSNLTSNEIPHSLEPRLSLSKWMLWQTTPQRTHMVSHSSRSLLLVHTTEKINFFDAENQNHGEQNISTFVRPNNPNPISANNDGHLSEENLNPPVINLCSDDDFGEFDYMEIAPTQEIVCQENDRSLLIPKKLTDRISPLPIIQEGNLLKRLFGIVPLNLPCKSSSCFLKPPPVFSDSLTLESFSDVLIEPEPLVESKNCTLRILNNKMRARLKRKSKEIGIKLSFSFVEERINTSMKENITFESSLITQSKAKENIGCFDVSFRSITPVRTTKSKCEDNLDQTMLPKAITFDIDFDIPEVFEEKFSDEIDNAICSPSRQEAKCDVPETTSKQDQDFCSFDGDSSLIFEQFFSNKDDDIADKLEASFCSPLMIKKVVFERDSSNTKEVQKETPKHKNLNLHKHNVSSIKRRRTEPTQYSLTQLVSLIDHTEQIDKNVDESKKIGGFKMALDVTHNKADENDSSDEEIEPTPPREIIPVASKFCYRSNSANFDSDIPQKDVRQNKQKAPLSPVASNSKISFDLSFSPTKTEDKELKHAETTKVKPTIQDTVNCAPDPINVTKPICFPKGLSFDLSDIHYSPEDTSSTKLEKCNEVNDFHENITLNLHKQAVVTSPDKMNSKISFDLSEISSSRFEKPDEKAKTCVEQEDSFYIKTSLEDSEQNVLNRRILFSPTKFETNISFDLSDVQFSPEEKCPTKDIQQNVHQRKLNTNLEQHNTNISFDLSDEIFSFGNKNEKNAKNVLGIKKQGKVNNSVNNTKQSISKNISNTSISKNAIVSFDLSDIQFSQQIDKDSDVKEKATSKENNYPEGMDPITSFESEALDKVFFDISFDFPDLKTDSSFINAEPAEPKSNKISETASTNNAEQSKFLNQSTTKPHNFVIPQTSLSHKSNISHSSVLNPLSNLNALQKSDYLNVSKPSTSTFQFRNAESLRMIDSFIPLESNDNTNGDKNPSLKHISDLSSLQKSPESPNVFALGKKRKRHNVLDDTTLASPCAYNAEVDDFIQPTHKVNSPEVIQNKKTRHKGRGKNKFLLTQADVSGSESSGDEIDEDEDCMDESFINDNSVVESPLNQRAMYLQSVKNIIGQPQKFKLKERSYGSDHQVCSQPVDEGCSDYLLDSFCVDDEEVTFTSSNDEAEISIENNRPQSNKRKRKRIIAVADTSSSEEEFVKKINWPEDEEIFVRKLTPKSSFLNKEKSSKFYKTTNLVNNANNDEITSNISSVKYIGKPKDMQVAVSQLKSVHKLSIPSCSKFTFKPTSSNIQEPIQIKNNSNETEVQSVPKPAKLAKPLQRSDLVSANSKVTPEPTEDLRDLNFTFDIGWDDVDPEPMKIDTSSNLPKSNNESNFQTITDTNATTSSHLNQSQGKVSEDVFATDINNRKCSTQIISCLNSGTPSTANNTAGIKTILVDSRELASGKPVISALRNKHGVNPFVMQLVSADYILSNKVAVERIVDSDFPSFGLPMKLIEKVRAMSELYEKSIVIIEKDSRKRAMGFNKFSTKYLQFAVYANLHPSIRVLYSNSIEETASIIFDIIEKERKKGLHIDVPVALNPSSQKLYDFYLSLPHVSPICAFNFVYQFPSVKLFCSSSVDKLKKAGFISTRKATAVLHFLSSELLIASFS